MASGQKRVIINNLERLVIDDTNNLQDFIAQERNDIIRALTQLGHGSSLQPGVALPPSGSAATPLAGVVLDGLDMVVDSPGSVLINPGVLVCWMGPGATAQDTGTMVVVDPGIQTVGVLVIATNTSGSPRCDVIECRVRLDGTGAIDEEITQESRDFFNETTEEFTPAMCNKTSKAVLEYRVRQGTPGSAPGYEAGWLPLGLAIIQTGATTAQVDFYDVRPLWREMKNTAAGVIPYTPIKNREGYVDSVYAGTVAAAMVRGYSVADLDGLTLGGILFKNSPCNPANLAGFASTASGGGSEPGVLFTPDNMLRGGSVSVTADDLLLVSAWMPNLGGSMYLPRCVRYSEETSPADAPALPTRRRPFGANGILLASSLSQDALPKHMYGVAKTLSASGIAGVLGSGYGVPLAVAAVGHNGAEVLRVRQLIPGLAGWRTPNLNAGVWDGGPEIAAAIDGTSRYATLDLTPTTFNGVRKVHIWGHQYLAFGTSTSGYVTGELRVYISASADPTSVLDCIHVKVIPVGGLLSSNKISVRFDFEVDLFAAIDALGTQPHPYVHLYTFGGETITWTTGLIQTGFRLIGVQY